MNEISLKTHYSVAELLKLKLSTLPQAHKNVLDKAKRENWESRKRVGKGGGMEYALCSLPQALQDEIRTKFAVSIVKAKPKSFPADLRQVELKTLTEKQREVAGARMALVAQVAQLEQAQPRYKAIKFFCKQIKHGGISDDLMRLVETANNKKGKNRTLSERTLNQWVLDYEKADTPEDDWLRMDSALFYSEVKDAIEEVAISKKLNQYQNVGKEAFKGVELAVNVFATDNLTLGANYTYTHAKNKTQDTIVKNVPKHKFFAFVDWKILPNLSLYVSQEAEHGRYYLDGGETVKLSGFGNSNAKLIYEPISRLSLEAGVSNLFDKNYYYQAGYPEEGRVYFGNIRYKF